MSERYVSIFFPHLVTDWFTITNADLQGKAFVIRVASHGRMLVGAASPAAQAQGIAAGMLLADAKAIDPGLFVFDEKPALLESLLKRLSLWAIRFTPLAAVDLPNGILLQATGCAHLWDGEEAYLMEVKRRLQERGYHVRLAMAGTIGVAWALARYANDSLLVKSGEEAKSLLPLPVSALRMEAETVERLNKLGLPHIANLLHLPRPALLRRFGPQVLLRLDQAFGKEAEILQPVQPIEPYQERLPCLDPIITTTGIKIALEQLLQTLCRRLQREGKGLRVAVLKAYQINGGLAQVVIETGFSSNSAAHLFRLFEIKLPIIQPESGIELFVLEAKNIEAHVPRQETIWEGTPSVADVRIAELLDRFVGKFGKACIHRFLPDEHYWPERSVRKAVSLNEQANVSWQEEHPRPVLLLKNPQPIEVAAPIPDYPPMHFRYKGKLHKISKADGPERIEQEWWIEGGEHRDYYLVEDDEGKRYWIFRLGHYGEGRTVGWFLHGFFA